MDYKKLLVAAMVLCFSLTSASALASDSGEPVEIHPARTDTVGGFSKDLSKPSSLPAKKDSISKPSDKRVKPASKTKRHNNVKKKLKPKKILINYSAIEKNLDENDFQPADRLINIALTQNSKDLRAKSLQAVFYAKQGKITAAQNITDGLLKKYPQNADLHYAQGVINYKCANSSELKYISKSPAYMSKALWEFKKATMLDKNNYQAYNALGVVYMKSKNYKDAKAAFKKALSINPQYATALDNLGTVDYAEGKLADADKKFQKSLWINPKSATANYHLAQVAFDKGAYQKAIDYLSKSASINPNMPQIYSLYGNVYSKLGNDGAAINAYKKAIGLKPEFTAPYYNLACMYEKRGDFEFAAEQLKTALASNPNDNVSRLKLADISYSGGKYSQAIDNYSALVGTKDFNDASLKGLANSYFEQAQELSSKGALASNGDFFKAFDNVNKAIDSNGDDLELHLAKLKLAKLTNQPEISETVLKGIIQSPKTDMISNVSKGEAYLALNDYSDAKKSFDTAVNSAQNAQDSLGLAEIFICHKQYDSALVVLQNVLKKDPQNTQALNTIEYIKSCQKYAEADFKAAKYYLSKNNSVAAKEYLTRSISMNPNSADAHLILAQLLEKQKDFEGAVKNYRIYVGLEPNAENVNKIKKKIEKYDTRL